MAENSNTLKVLKGVDTVAFARKLSASTAETAHLIPWQTSLKFDPSRDTDSTVTKDGPVNTTSSPETDLEVEFLHNTSAIADEMYDSLYDGETLEVWVVYRNRKNADGKYFAWYLQAVVSEDENDNDSDDNSTRDVSFNVNGKPKRGWTTLPADAQEALDYVFRGLDKVVPKSGDTPETNGGEAWQDSDAGTNSVTE